MLTIRVNFLGYVTELVRCVRSVIYTTLPSIYAPDRKHLPWRNRVLYPFIKLPSTTNIICVYVHASVACQDAHMSPNSARAAFAVIPLLHKLWRTYRSGKAERNMREHKMDICAGHLLHARSLYICIDRVDTVTLNLLYRNPWDYNAIICVIKKRGTNTACVYTAVGSVHVANTVSLFLSHVRFLL